MEKCPICLNILNDETITITNCNHTFCDTCINKSIDTNGVRCPLCRSSIKEFYNKNERTKIIIKTKSPSWRQEFEFIKKEIIKKIDKKFRNYNINKITIL